MIGEAVMARFTLILFAACAIGTGVASALDDAAARKQSLENATREELLAKIANLEQQLTELKSQQKQRVSQYEAISKQLTYTVPFTGQALPVPPPRPLGILRRREYQDSTANGLHAPAMPNAHRDPLSDMPKGTSARQFNGMTVYNVPCTYRTVNGVPEYAGSAGVAALPSVGAEIEAIREAESKHQIELQRFYQRKNSSIQRNRTEKPLPMNTSSAASLRP
jgi:hypothetical protein